VRRASVPAKVDEAALEARVTARVLAYLVAALGGAVEVWPKTSARKDAPRGVSPRRWSKLAAEIGRKPHEGSRFYLVTRADWEVYLARLAPDAEVIPPRLTVTTAKDASWSPTAALLASGLRATR
jgi:hypothetical protein